MSEKTRVEGSETERRDPDERYGNAPETHIWQAHVQEEEAKHSSLHYWAQEYAERATRGVDATPNEFQLAEAHGERHGAGDVSSDIANAGDIAGG